MRIRPDHIRRTFTVCDLLVTVNLDVRVMLSSCELCTGTYLKKCVISVSCLVACLLPWVDKANFYQSPMMHYFAPVLPHYFKVTWLRSDHSPRGFKPPAQKCRRGLGLSLQNLWVSRPLKHQSLAQVPVYMPNHELTTQQWNKTNWRLTTHLNFRVLRPPFAPYSVIFRRNFKGRVLSKMKWKARTHPFEA